MGELTTFYTDIRQILEQARGKAQTAVNSAMVEAYWQIGKRIVQEEQQGESKAKYGKRLMEELSKALTADFGKGFSYANLYNCRQFYLKFPEQEILYTLCRELSWSHLRLIMRVENPDALAYYCNESRNENWTVRQLERNIKSHSYQRLLSTQNQPEKEQLIKDKKIKKQKPLPPISADENPFALPEGWVWCRTGALLNKFSTGPFGSMLHKSDYVPIGIPLVNPANIVNGSIVPSNKMMIDKETRKRLSKYILKIGELVIARRGDLSKCAIVGKEEEGWLCGTGSFFIQPSEFMDKDFFLKVYRSYFFQKQLVDTSIGQTMVNLNQKILNSNRAFNQKKMPDKFKTISISGETIEPREIQIQQGATLADKIKLRSFLTTLYFGGELGR